MQHLANTLWTKLNRDRQWTGIAPQKRPIVTKYVLLVVYILVAFESLQLSFKLLTLSATVSAIPIVHWAVVGDRL